MSEKKPLEQLISEHHEARQSVGKIFVHRKSQQKYQLLMTVHDKETQVLNAVYCLCALTQLKFTRPYVDFINAFEPPENMK